MSLLVSGLQPLQDTRPQAQGKSHLFVARRSSAESVHSGALQCLITAPRTREIRE